MAFEDYETGEPPTHPRPIYAEHMNNLARSGTEPEVDPTSRHYALGLEHRYHGVGNQPMTDNERAFAEATWAQLPDWNELARATNNALRWMRRVR
jgi:hypothetical protein